MPSTSSKKQHNLMAMVANNPAAAKRVKVPQSVGQEFMAADKGRRFRSEGRADSQAVNKPKTNQGSQELFSKGGEMKESKAMVGKEMAFMKKKGAPKSMIKHEMAEAGMKKMAGGGMTMVNKGGKMVPSFAADGVGKMAKGGGVKKMAAGGLSSGHKAADGVAVKGRTVTQQVAMKRGGKC
jgi:hypothetical protein